MRLGVFTTFMPEYTFPEACALIRAVGFEGVQPRIVPRAQSAAGFDPAQPFNPWGNNKGGIAEEDFVVDPLAVLQPAVEAGLAITSVASYTSTADMERAVAMVRACGRAGIRHVRVGTLPLPAEARFDLTAYRARCRDAYRELVAEAQRVNVRPCLELHMNTIHPGASAAMALLDGFAPDEVGILYDPGNMIADGWETPRVALHVLGPYLAEVHVKNTQWVPAAPQPSGGRRWTTASAPLEDGCVDWPGVIEQLHLHGFAGWLVEESHEPGRATHERLRQAHTLLDGWVRNAGAR